MLPSHFDVSASPFVYPSPPAKMERTSSGEDSDIHEKDRWLLWGQRRSRVEARRSHRGPWGVRVRGSDSDDGEVEGVQ